MDGLAGLGGLAPEINPVDVAVAVPEGVVVGVVVFLARDVLLRPPAGEVLAIGREQGDRGTVG